MKNLKTEHCRLLNEAKELMRQAREKAAAVGFVHGISAIISAVNRGEDAHAWESELSDTLVKAVDRLHEADDEIDKAIEIVIENGGADDEDRS